MLPCKMNWVNNKEIWLIEVYHLLKKITQRTKRKIQHKVLCWIYNLHFATCVTVDICNWYKANSTKVQNVFEPKHAKTYLLKCAPHKDTHHPAHPRSLIRVCVVRMKKLCILAYPICAQWILWSDCANAQSIWIFAGRTCPKVRFLKVVTRAYTTGLGGSVGCAVRLETRRSRVQPLPWSAIFFRGDWSWNIFYGQSLPSADSRRAFVSYNACAKY